MTKASPTPGGGQEKGLEKGIAKVDDNHVRIDRAVRDRIFETGGADFMKTLRFREVRGEDENTNGSDDPDE